MTIRRTPDDFRVEELNTAAFLASIAPERTPSHPFVAYRLVKRGIATPDAIGFIARALRVGREHVAAAGLKDRHAVTSQIVTVDGAALRGAPPRELGERLGAGDPHADDGGSSWRIEGVGFVPRAADSTIIERNRFRIVVRGLDKWHADEMARRASMLVDRAGAPLLVVNYFGDQRFGSARHGQGFVARALIRGDFEHALRLAIGTPARKDSGAVRTMSRALAAHWGDWPTALAKIPRMPERGAIEVLARGGSFKDAFTALPRFTQEICVEAYQSHLWNAIVRELAHALAETTSQRAFEADDLFGTLVFPRAAALTPAFRALPIPMPSPRARMPECLSEIVAGVLADEGTEEGSKEGPGGAPLALGDLRIPGVERPYFGGGDRPFVIEARNFELTAPERDSFAGNSTANLAITTSFDLPRGSYATVVLRALGQ